MKPVKSLHDVSSKWVAIKYGVLTTLTMIAYFMLVRELDAIRITGLRFLNYAIVFVGMYLALREYQEKRHTHSTNYFRGMGMLFILSGVCCLSFGLFMVIVSWVDMNFLSLVSTQMPHSGVLTPVMVGFEIASETFLISAILIMMVLMLFKRNHTARLRKAGENNS
jgi:hypothetical protein